VTGTLVLRRLLISASDVFRVVARAKEPIRRVLTFSLADKVIWPEKNFSVSIEGDRFSVGYGSRLFSRIRVRASKAYPFERGKGPQPEALVSSVKLALSELKASPRDITLVIPKSWVIMRTVVLPATVKENLPGVISFEMDRVTPLSADDALYDFSLLEEKEDKIKILIAACKTEAVRPYVQALAAQGISVGRITPGL
jgi:hypothetical protein